MKCIILAAGYATRLYPLTENFPKPLLTVGGKTILDWLVDDLEETGEVDGYVVVTNRKFAQHFTDWAGTKQADISVVDDGTLTNETRLGAVKDILLAINEKKLDDDLLVLAGDNVLSFSLSHFVDYCKQKNASCVMRYFEPDEARLQRAGVAEIADDDRVLRLEEKPEKPKSHWCTPPFYFYKREDVGFVAKAIDDGCGTDAPGSFISYLCRHTAVYSMEMPGRRFDIGTLEGYKKIDAEYKGITE